MSVYIRGMEMPKTCYDCHLCEQTDYYASPYCRVSDDDDMMCINEIRAKRRDNCPLIPVPDHGGLFDVNQFEKGCFYGYGHDGRVYKLFWDERVFEGAKKFYINPIIPADKEDGE